ncbi:hypothetical protein ACVOMV_13205 [Mesorhizobium atlanticum]
MMRDVVIAAALLLAATVGVARAEPNMGNWSVGSGNDGQITASLHASNKLITGGGALGYSPVLTLACRPDGEPRWSEWLQLDDAVSASRKITISVVVDGGKTDESWSVGPRGRTLVRDGNDGIKRPGFGEPADAVHGASACCRGVVRRILSLPVSSKRSVSLLPVATPIRLDPTA